MLSLRFLGTGTAHSEDLGTSAAVLEEDGRPLLLLDCGSGVPRRYRDHYGDYPRALFISHVHLDHIAGLEQLYSTVALDEQRVQPVRIYVPAPVIERLHERIGTLERPLAERLSNFWDVFQLIPVTGRFWHEELRFDIFEARHHAPRFAWGLTLANAFLYTGDTRPIPEVLAHYVTPGLPVFHDCALHGNPSHSGWDDLQREYPAALLSQLIAYHYESESAGVALQQAGARIARPGEAFELGPRPAADAC